MDFQVLVKSDDETDPAHGQPPEERPIAEHIRKGIVNLDKPSGPTSHQAASWVKEILKIKKAGHSGTLDPKVTGVLPIALEDATRVLSTLLPAGKQYMTLMTLHGDVKAGDIKKTLSYFQGEIYQRPPLKSAVKRQLRTKRVYRIQVIEREERNILYSVDCEAGTYIRKLCHDIGLMLGVGAHMKNLRRTKVGPFTEEGIVSLHDLKDAYEFYLEGDETHLRECIKPLEYAVKDMKKIWLKDGAISAICHGADLNMPGVSRLDRGIKNGEEIALMSLKDELVATGISQADSQGIMEAKKGKAVKLSRVFMEPEVYPRHWKTL